MHDLELPASVCARMHQGWPMLSHFPLAPPQTATTSYVCRDSTGQERCSASHTENINSHTHTHTLMQRNAQQYGESEIA